MSQFPVYNSSRAADRQAPLWRIIAGYLLVFIAPLIALSPLFNAQFVSMDDWATISKNPDLNPPTGASLARYWARPAGSLYVPATYGLWWMIASIDSDLNPPKAPLDPGAFHGTNVVLHAMTSLLIAAIIRRLLKSDLAAVVGGLFFALHPLQVEAVGWASGTKDLLAGFFSGWTIWLYLLGLQASVPPSNTLGRGRERSRAALHVAAIVAFMLALLSKPSAMTVPAILLILDRWYSHRTWKQILLSIIPFAALSIAAASIAWVVQPALRAEPAPLWMRPLMVGDAITFYLSKLIAPIHLAPIYARTVKTLASGAWLKVAWIVPTILVLALVIIRRQFAVAGIALAIFAIALSPMLGLFRFDFQYYSTVADHYAYFAMLGPAVIAGWLVKCSTVNIRRSTIIGSILLIALAALSFRQSRFWHDDETLFTHSLDVAPNGLLALQNLGNVRMHQGRNEEAIALFKRAISVEPHHFESLGAMAPLLAREGKIEESNAAFDAFLHELETMPDSLRPKQYGMYAYSFASTMLKQGHRENAAEYFRKVLAIYPDDLPSKQGLKAALDAPATTTRASH